MEGVLSGGVEITVKSPYGTTRMSTLRVAAAFTIATTIAGFAGSARANGRFPFAQQVVVGPGSGSDVVVLRTTFGLLVSRDAGRGFHWVCEEAMFFPYVPGLVADPAVEVTADGRVVFSFESGVHSFSDGCGVARQASTADHDIVDLTTTPSGDILYGVESTAGSPSYVLRGGSHTDLARVSQALDGLSFVTVEVAPSEITRLYLSAVETNSRVPRLLRSDDSGATVRALTVPDSLLGDGAYVSGVDPTNPDVVFVRIVVGFGSELLRSTDGGASFHRVAATRDAMLGFALSDDGRTVWYGSHSEGLFRSTDNGQSFARVNTLPTLCLKQHSGALWACTDWISQPWALGRSSDNGQHFTPVLRFGDINGPPECMAPDEGVSQCLQRWPVLRETLGDPRRPRDASTNTDVSTLDASMLFDVPRDALPPDRTPPDGSTHSDLGAFTDSALLPPPPPPQHSGCDCSTVTLPPSPLRSPLGFFFLALTALYFRRRTQPRFDCNKPSARVHRSHGTRDGVGVGPT